ncbi:MAG: S1C family serine protease, partial [Armatimonadota bacterium]
MTAATYDARKAVESVVAKVKPSLVRIHVVEADYQQGREIKVEGFGSGVIISKEGHVITNHHVAGHAKRIVCTLADKTQIDAELVGTDAQADIAVIKLLPEKTDYDFPVAKFGDSSQLKVGDTVLAMGSPLAFSQSVTMGIVSNTELIIPKMFGEFEMDGEDIGSIVRWIAHDAQIFPGNSGGPLVNMKGEIVGINEISLGLSGAIPGNLAREVAEQIIKNGK